MKLVSFALLSAFIVAGCNRPSKDLASVEIGMTKAEVTGIVGEPKKKDVVNNTEVWTYPDSSRTVVFRMDTVYAIMTTPQARLDSMSAWMDSTNNKVKKSLGKVGDKIENTVEKIQDRADGDSTKTE